MVPGSVVAVQETWRTHTPSQTIETTPSTASRNAKVSRHPNLTWWSPRSKSWLAWAPHLHSTAARADRIDQVMNDEAARGVWGLDEPLERRAPVFERRTVQEDGDKRLEVFVFHVDRKVEFAHDTRIQQPLHEADVHSTLESEDRLVGGKWTWRGPAGNEGAPSNEDVLLVVNNRPSDFFCSRAQIIASQTRQT